MTLTDPFGNCYLPTLIGGVPSFGSSTLDATGEYIAYVFKIPKTGTLKKVAIKIGTVTTADPVLIRLETVDDTTGCPTGTLYDANATGTLETPTSTSIPYISINGTTGIGVTKNNIVALKLSLDYTDGNLSIYTYVSNNEATSAFPYMVSYVGSSYTKLAVGSLCMILEYDNEIINTLGMFTPMNTTSLAFSSSSTPNHRGIKITMPFTAKVTGVYGYFDIDNAAELILYDSDGVTALQTITLPGPNIRNSANSGYYKLYLDTAQTLNKDSSYRLILKPTTTSTVSETNITFTNDGSLLGINQLPLGINACYTYCTGTPDELIDWTDDTTIRPMMGLIYDQIDLPASTGGGRPAFGDRTGGKS